MHDGAAHLVALEQDDAEARLHEAKRCAHAGGAGSDHHGVVRVGGGTTGAPDDVVRGLASLAHGVANETHPAELADDVDARALRLEVGIEHGQLDPALGASVDELDRVDGARRHAGGMADAGERVQELRLPPDDAQDVLLGAYANARARSDAPVRIDDRVDGVGHDFAERRYVLQGGEHLLLFLGGAPGPDRVDQRGDDHGHDDADELGHRQHHQMPPFRRGARLSMRPSSSLRAARTLLLGPVSLKK